MTRKHTRRAVRPLHNPFAVARNQATRLTAAELDEVMVPIRAAATRMRQGLASHDDHAMLDGSLRLAKSIEQQGIVRGLAGHLADFESALAAIGARATTSTGRWNAPTLHFHEIEAIQLFLDLHLFQIKALSFGEFRRAYDLTTAHIRTARLPLVQLGKGAVACN